MVGRGAGDGGGVGGAGEEEREVQTSCYGRNESQHREHSQR